MEVNKIDLDRYKISNYNYRLSDRTDTRYGNEMNKVDKWPNSKHSKLKNLCFYPKVFLTKKLSRIK
ncbi:hypothetical protein BLOT_015737 [Blomia tropicalis]|nr:hypothetical protein BLOT_015737 [Blomia tropicalis]